MAKKSAKKSASQSGDGTEDIALDYRHHHARRSNNPTGGNAAEGKVEPTEKKIYAYDPHRPPMLRYDETGRSDAMADRMAALLAKAQAPPTSEGVGSLTPEETALLADALRQGQPWLEWAGKREQPAFVVDAPAIHLHERISSRALLRIAARKDIQRSLFGESDLSYTQSVQFYHHSVNWANRLILGDNRAVMASLAYREGLAGKVQTIYVDPPYGIKFRSNFQSEIGRKDISDSNKDVDLTREMETVKAYRDTWNLGSHSYLSYLRDRLLVGRDLLCDSGSVFVQISDENVHLVRSLMDEIFGPENFCSLIPFTKTTGFTPKLISNVTDYLIWYAKDRRQVKFRRLYAEKNPIGDPSERYVCVETDDGEVIDLSLAQKKGERPMPQGRILKLRDVTSQGSGEDSTIEFQERSYLPPPNRHWSIRKETIPRFLKSGYAYPIGKSLMWKCPLDSFPYRPLNNVWTDIQAMGFGEEKLYAVQTASGIISRCILMTTDPGDLVLDPTCGSGTSALVAEQWGRRWITIDTSRVAIAIARQRIMTFKFDYYKLRDEVNGPTGGFYYATATHVTLGRIAQNTAIDSILDRHEPILAERLAKLNDELDKVSNETRSRLLGKLEAKRKSKSKDGPITDADERRWNLPVDRWSEWQVPFDSDPDWPEPLKEALIAFRLGWRAKRDEVDKAIAVDAVQEELVHLPEVEKGIIRVSGPFTVEALQPAEESLEEASPVDLLDDELEAFGAYSTDRAGNAEAYLDKMTRLLKADGVRFTDNVQVGFDRLDRASGGILNAAGEWHPEGEGREARNVAVVFGPQYGPITGNQVESALRAAFRAKIYDDLVFAGFSFDSAAQAVIQDDPNPKVRCHLAFIRPDVNLDGLLKETPNSQLFTVFGLPRARLESAEDGQIRAVMEGVDVYNPVKNEVFATGADKVAAWFLDSDYDGRTFCICQAFFPNRSAWDKLGKALKGVIDEEALASFAGTISQPFDPPKGAEPRVAIKVIDPRGNEVLRVLNVPRGA